MDNKNEKALLLGWNPKISDWDYERAYSKLKNNKKFKETWQTFLREGVTKGIEVFIIKLGGEKEERGIIGHGYVVKEPYLKNEIYCIKIKFDKILDYENEKIIGQTELEEKIPEQFWSPRKPSIGIDEPGLSKLREMWNKLINREENSKTSNGGDEKETMKKEFDKNVIFYGPPGTGKTYTTAKRVVAICDNVAEEDLTDYAEVMKKYNELKKKIELNLSLFINLMAMKNSLKE